jgi:hypothetical protein
MGCTAPNDRTGAVLVLNSDAVAETRHTRTWILDIKQLAWREDIE